MRTKLRLALLALSVLGASGAAFGQDAAGPSKESGPATAPPVSAEKPKRMRIGGRVASANLTHMVQPAYPQAAKDAHISGTVVLHCIIAKDGTMSQVEYVSGPPLLMKAAMDAVRQWTYKPTTLNGEAVEVDTVVSVVFQLGEKSSGDSQQGAGGTTQNGGDSSSRAASTDAAASAAIDPQLKADILHLMDVTHFKEKQATGMKTVLGTMRPTLLASIPNTPNREKIVDSYIEKLGALLQTESFNNAITALYARYLTDADVKAASAFYETPAGQHYLESSQQLLPEAMKIGQRIAGENIPSILKDLCKEYPELEGEAKFCAEPDPTKTSLLPGKHSPAGN
jgi:TonB family protein